MLTQFRIRYPRGSLISELVKIDRGKYVVRVLVQVEGVTLATGLAAADTVEQAEDQARNRALAVVDLNPPKIDRPEAIDTKVREVPVPNGSPTQPEDTDYSLTEPKPSPVQASPATDEKPKSNFPLDEQFSSSSTETVPDVATPLKLADTSPAPPAAPPASDYALSEPPPTQQQLNSSTAPKPIDFSDIIAKTNLELKRLGWTNEQGRDYLLQTYGKRSRQLLSDEELLEFLQFLESQ